VLDTAKSGFEAAFCCEVTVFVTDYYKKVTNFVTTQMSK
jgi:hypothetical protein